jgi:N-acetylglucosaminyl-diphospho-decaprenol L-rhamnosyltransferase
MGVERPELSLAIVLFNSADVLEGCLRSIQPALESRWAELIAVNNASPDGSLEVVRREAPAARTMSLAENRGFAGGANVALARATGRYWMLLNPDVRVPAGALETLVAWMDKHPQVALASPEIVAADGSWQSPGRAMPAISRTLLELTRLHRLLPRRTRGRILRGPYWTGGDQLKAGWIPGTAMVVRPEAARDVGSMREELFMYGEDIEWCWRMRRAGWCIGVCSSVTVTHQTGSSAKLSFGEGEASRRVAQGIDSACRLMYGRGRARALAAVTALGLQLDSLGRVRDPADRVASKKAARLWAELAAHR